MKKKVLITGGSGFIGTNLIELLLQWNYDVLNFDSKNPNNESHRDLCKKIDILDYGALKTSINNYSPEFVIHLAARTDVNGTRLEDYSINTKGTKNLINAVNECSSVKRIIITSTQFVHQNGTTPKNDTDYNPHTIYGESKVITEKIIRESELNCMWTIIRPTNIWGPWHPRYPNEFWKVLSKGLYIHPGKKSVLRSYGYVGNVVWQIQKIMEAPENIINRQVFYVGDDPMDLYLWVREFSIKLIGKEPLVLPRSVLYSASILGDVLKFVNIKFPITTSRYKSMTTPNPAPMSKTMETFGTPPYTLSQAVDETIEWLKIHHPELVRINYHV